ncbi:MAG: type II toxin-antitoxin system RelE/ParE family toxin, partial [Thiobacillus sp.]
PCPPSAWVLLKSGCMSWASGALFMWHKFEDAVYVLHAFRKKTQKTRKEDIDLAARRYKQIGG